MILEKKVLYLSPHDFDHIKGFIEEDELSVKESLEEELWMHKIDFNEISEVKTNIEQIKKYNSDYIDLFEQIKELF